jgi:hypothetical protein
MNTHPNPDPHHDNVMPDISVYVDGDVPDMDIKTDFSNVDLFIQLRLAGTSDPFRDPKDP